MKMSSSGNSNTTTPEKSHTPGQGAASQLTVEQLIANLLKQTSEENRILRQSLLSSTSRSPTTLPTTPGPEMPAQQTTAERVTQSEAASAPDTASSVPPPTCTRRSKRSRRPSSSLTDEKTEVTPTTAPSTEACCSSAKRRKLTHDGPETTTPTAQPTRKSGRIVEPSAKIANWHNPEEVVETTARSSAAAPKRSTPSTQDNGGFRKRHQCGRKEPGQAVNKFPQNTHPDEFGLAVDEGFLKKEKLWAKEGQKPSFHPAFWQGPKKTLDRFSVIPVVSSYDAKLAKKRRERPDALYPGLPVYSDPNVRGESKWLHGHPKLKMAKENGACDPNLVDYWKHIPPHINLPLGGVAPADRERFNEELQEFQTGNGLPPRKDLPEPRKDLSEPPKLVERYINWKKVLVPCDATAGFYNETNDEEDEANGAAPVPGNRSVSVGGGSSTRPYTTWAAQRERIRRARETAQPILDKFRRLRGDDRGMLPCSLFSKSTKNV